MCLIDHSLINQRVFLIPLWEDEQENKDKNEGIAEFLTKIYNLRKKGSKRQALSTILMVTSAWIIKTSITITKNTTTPFSTE